MVIEQEKRQAVDTRTVEDFLKRGELETLLGSKIALLKPPEHATIIAPETTKLALPNGKKLGEVITQGWRKSFTTERGRPVKLKGSLETSIHRDGGIVSMQQSIFDSSDSDGKEYEKYRLRVQRGLMPLQVAFRKDIPLAAPDATDPIIVRTQFPLGALGNTEMPLLMNSRDTNEGNNELLEFAKWVGNMGIDLHVQESLLLDSDTLALKRRRLKIVRTDGITLVPMLQFHREGRMRVGEYKEQRIK